MFSMTVFLFKATCRQIWIPVNLQLTMTTEIKPSSVLHPKQT